MIRLNHDVRVAIEAQWPCMGVFGTGHGVCDVVSLGRSIPGARKRLKVHYRPRADCGRSPLPQQYGRRLPLV